MPHPNSFAQASLLYARYELYCYNPYMPHMLPCELHGMPSGDSCVPLTLCLSNETSATTEQYYKLLL